MDTNQHLEAIVDIGTSKVVVLVGCFAPNRQVEIVGYGESESQGIHRGVILNTKEAAESIKMAVSMAQKDLQEPIKRVTVGINGHKLRNEIVQIDRTFDPGTEICTETLQSIMKEAKSSACKSGETSYHISPISFIINSETLINNPLNYTARELSSRYHVITGPMDYQNMLIKCFESLHLHVNKIIVHPSILGRYALSKEEKEMGSAVVDFGCGLTTIALYYRSRLYHTASIPFGGEVITSDIMEAFQTIEDYAEKLKTTHGTVTSLLPNKSIRITLPGTGEIKAKDISLLALSEVIEARLEEINEAIVFQMEKYDLIEKMGAGVVISGGGANFKGIQNLLSYDVGREVRIYNPQDITGVMTTKLMTCQYATSTNLLHFVLDKAIKENRPKKNISDRSKSTKREKEKEMEENQKRPSFFNKCANKLLHLLEDDNSDIN
ncbi:cell division protein FtsA [Halosquirtibacter laminarini]|uniref:Cell division protein FtsA n=1 Tax=Halosquirtibacter laminarini TaxID=3374600 RepID=A0AC61NJ03_9BACT|nr:cell division protein FtsA [Prolixibacteraceae bacterium]